MNDPMYRDDLDGMECGNPGCDHTAHDSEMVLASICHPHAGQEVSYRNGVLDVSCNRCGKDVAMIAVADHP